MNNMNNMNNTTKIKILTKRKCGSSHEETDLTINWDGVTPEHLRILAHIAIVHNWQSNAFKSKESLPTEVTIEAKDAVHEPASCLQRFSPDQLKQQLFDKKIDKILKELTPEQLFKLFEQWNKGTT
ncbi:MAG: hypothetical protein DDT42_01855 [candidate division WS2 bacterium]|uniref:Uncharacterized protein n=1 Tax=Psychracetigena formicireducens TaxID=2986056 RepID=A0A9E2F597_PSYF1|nr:hypothetical protein [Candidatus Psychracetigena formicireducens]